MRNDIRTSSPASLIDLERYPILDLASPAAQAVIARCRADLKAEGASNLYGFIRPQALEVLVAEAKALLPDAIRKETARNVYVTPVDPTWPEDHPGRKIHIGRNSQIAYDQIHEGAAIRRLFNWDALTNFVAAALSKPKLYQFADPFQALNLIYLKDGDEAPWHFDHNDSTVTLLLQGPEAGGEFEYVPFFRRKDDENLDGVRRLLNGDRSNVRVPDRWDGTLTLFLGEFSAHRVARVKGPRARITAIMTYDEVPDRVSSDETNALVYGPRAAAIIAARKASGASRPVHVRDVSM